MSTTKPSCEQTPHAAHASVAPFTAAELRAIVEFDEALARLSSEALTSLRHQFYGPHTLASTAPAIHRRAKLKLI
jgi:hypothetical protein